MRVHRDGYIQAKRLDITLSSSRWHSAINVGMYRNEGIEREIEQEIGITIEGALRVRSELNEATGNILVRVESDWVRPTRS
jgi:hypothetical protein